MFSVYFLAIAFGINIYMITKNLFSNNNQPIFILLIQFFMLLGLIYDFME